MPGRKGKTMKLKLNLLGATLIGAAVLSPAVHAATVFDGLNVLVQDSFQSQFSEVQGVLAVGGNATLFNYGVDLLSTPYGGAGGYGLVVGGDLTFTSGGVGTPIANPAQTYYGGTLSGSLVNYTAGINNSVNPLSFNSLFNQASVASTALAGYSNTGAATLDPGGYSGWLALTGDGSSAGQGFSIRGT